MANGCAALSLLETNASAVEAEAVALVRRFFDVVAAAHAGRVGGVTARSWRPAFSTGCYVLNGARVRVVAEASPRLLDVTTLVLLLESSPDFIAETDSSSMQLELETAPDGGGGVAAGAMIAVRAQHASHSAYDGVCTDVSTPARALHM
eukprot:SAG11_NODE_12909_length_679_cov_1.974138_1_plen_148_part_01